MAGANGVAVPSWGSGRKLLPFGSERVGGSKSNRAALGSRELLLLDGRAMACYHAPPEIKHLSLPMPRGHVHRSPTETIAATRLQTARARGAASRNCANAALVRLIAGERDVTQVR